MDKRNKMMDKKEIMELLNEQWSNAACCGYVIKTCTSLKLDKSIVNLILKELRNSFEIVTVEQAKKIYYDS
ncbi:MAG: hypothetical protein GXW99_12665 [Clostridiales bacterium]|jgi:uncharacterized protein YlxP (DUF503 family)|nr:hypothetical protein [Clostridiales bacterium]